jgi:hypothetical protein
MIEDGEREEIEKLLPWYATGRLGLSDTSKVERYLRQHPEVLAQLQFIGRERQETIRANEAMGWPPSGLSARLMSSLPDRARPTTARRQRLTLGQLFQLSPEFGARFAALAVVVLILAEAALIANVLTRERAYRLASGLHEDGLAALIAFADDAKASDIARFLTDFEANIVDGPKPGGIYKIRMRNLDKSQPMGDALLNKLAQRRDIVRIVLPSRD